MTSTNGKSTCAPSDIVTGGAGQDSVVHYLFEPGNGGLDRVAILLANAMAERGIPTELWLSCPNGPAAALISEKVVVRLVPTIKRGSRGLKLFVQIPALARMIRMHRPKAIFSAGNQSNLTLALAAALAKAEKTKAIQKITNPVIRPKAGKFSAFVRTLRFGFTASLGDCCLTLSEADRRQYSALMPRVADRFRAIANPYVSDEMMVFGAARDDRPQQPARAFISVGRLEEQKDHATLFRALARLTHLDWQLRIFGNGPLEPMLRSLARDLAIEDRVIFEGFCLNLSKVYCENDILILSSRWEGLPAVPFEALACGCDVVTTACSDGLVEELAPLGQRRVAVGDDAALAIAIEEAVSRPSTMRVRREIAATYSIDQSVSEHLQILTDLSEQG